jgi:hypothetical protein
LSFTLAHRPYSMARLLAFILLTSLGIVAVASARSEGGSASGAGVSAASWTVTDECPLPDRPLGLAPPKYLLWALCLYMIATQLVFWLGYVVCGNALGFNHTPPYAGGGSAPGESPPIVRATGLTSPHASALAHQNATVSAAAAAAHQNGAAKNGGATRRV